MTMHRSGSVKYRPAGNIPLTQRKEKRSLNAYNHATDNDIFALGDAAEDAGVNFSQFDIPDDIFKDFGFSLDEALQKQLGRSTDSPASQTGSVTYEVKSEDGGGYSGDEVQEHNGGFTGTPDDQERAAGDVQVSTITKTLPDGRTVHTRIMRGPIKTKRRIIKINRELPSGETELIGTYEAPNKDADVNSTVKYATDKLVPSIVQSETDTESEGSKIPPIAEVEDELGEDERSDTPEVDYRRMSVDGDYDNAPLLPSRTLPRLPKPRVFPGMQPKHPITNRFMPHRSREPMPFPVPEEEEDEGSETSSLASLQPSQTPQPNSYTPTPTPTPPPRSHPPLHEVASLPVPPSLSEETKKQVQISTPTPPETASPSESPTPMVNAVRKSSRSTSLPANSLLRKRSSIDEEVIELYPNTDLNIIHEISLDDGEGSGCPKWCPECCWCGKRRKKLLPVEDGKGKLGMTQSEINTDEKELPGLQGMVANYARMLVEDKQGFLETLFRAVKLNKLDVVKILCKIIQKSGLKLASRELRETESSATVLHVALLYNHTDVVDFLLDTRESGLIMAKYENDQYRNQTGLHVAVANGNPTMVEKLLLNLDMHQKQVLVNTIADGNYFKKQHPHGQLCLTAAAWAGNTDIIKMLVQYGGNLALKSHNGNTLLHSLVLQSSQHPCRHNYEMLLRAVWDATGIWADQMNYAARSLQQRELEQAQMQINLFKELLAIRNNDGFTPLALATSNNSMLFGYMLNLEKIYKIPQNKLGSITWVTYNVTDITSFAYDTYNKFSVLHILAHNSQRLSRSANAERQAAAEGSGEIIEDCLDMEPIKALIVCKWGVYRLMYIAWLFIHLAYMIVFTAATANHNSKPFNFTLPKLRLQDKLRPGLIKDADRHAAGEVYYGFGFFVILPILYILLEALDLFGNRPYRIQFMKGQHFIMRLAKCAQSEWTITGNGPYRLVNIFFSGFVLEWFLLYMTNDANQDIALAMALLLGWVFVLFFTRGCRVTSRFSIMIQKMFFRDLIYFLTVYGIILIGFSFAMNALFTYKGQSDPSANTISTVFYDMMNVVTDLDKKQSIGDARHLLFAKLLLIFYAIVAVILLMNMLIAMMNTSYETVRLTRCNLWKQQQLSIMLMLERRLFWWKWLCRKSEGDIWRKDTGTEIHTYLDVTVLHTNNYTAKNR